MISNTVYFWVYLGFLIPSVMCSLFAIIYLLINRTLRTALNNHIIIIVLVISLISEVTYYPWMLYFYKFNGTWRRSQIFCIIWAYLDWGLYITQTWLFAWATIERHILIFHDKWLSTKKKRLFLHYLPPLVLLLYTQIFYMIFYFFPPCKNYFSNRDMQCLDPCIIYNNTFSMWEMIAHQSVPGVIIIVLSIALFVRILWQKHRLHQPVHWRKHRKMAVQILSISLLYTVFFFPFVVYSFLQIYGVSQRQLRDFGEYALMLGYLMTLLLPFICILSLPELRTKFIKMLHFRRRSTRVAVVAIAVKSNIKHQAHAQ